MAATPLQCELLTPTVQKCKDEQKICYIFNLDDPSKVSISCTKIEAQPIEEAKKRP